MAKVVKNPFRFGGPVEGDYYFPRPELARTVAQFLDNNIHTVLIEPRRFGKTSFALNLLREQEQASKTGLFVDIFNITSHRDFLQQLLRALRVQKSWAHRLKDLVDIIPRLRPRLAMETDSLTGVTTFSLSTEISADKDVKETIQDVLAGLKSLGPRVIVVIDEFQKIAELEDGRWLEATLRTQMQQLNNTAFLFTGSRKSIIHDMLGNPARPFYRSCQLIDFPSLGGDFTNWIVSRFDSVGISCNPLAIEALRQRVQDTPNYVQMACFHLVARGVERVDNEEIDDVLRMIVRQNSYAYQTLLNSLSPIQQRALRLAAIEISQVYSKDILARYEIPSGPALASSFKALKGKQILDEGTARGRVLFDDPLFAIWLKTEFRD